jgi:hypothetical protein
MGFAWLFCLFPSCIARRSIYSKGLIPATDRAVSLLHSLRDLNDRIDRRLQRLPSYGILFKGNVVGTERGRISKGENERCGEILKETK